MKIKRNDTGIGIRATLFNENGVLDLTGADVLFLMGTHEITPMIEDVTAGKVLVVFEKNHTEKANVYRAEFEVLFKDGRTETYPSDGYLKVEIINDLGGR